MSDDILNDISARVRRIERVVFAATKERDALRKAREMFPGFDCDLRNEYGIYNLCVKTDAFIATAPIDDIWECKHVEVALRSIALQLARSIPTGGAK